MSGSESSPEAGDERQQPQDRIGDREGWTGAERERLLEELRRSQEQYRMVVDNTTDLIARFGRDHRAVFVNPAWAAVLGFSPEQWVGRTLGDMGLGDELDEVAGRAIDQVVTTGVPTELEVDLQAPDGLRFYRARVIPEGRPDGGITTVLVTATDLTERRRAEVALRASEERFRTALETLIDPFEVLDAVRDGSGRIVDFTRAYANQAALAWMGLAAADAIGGRVSERLPGETLASLVGAFAAVLDTGDPLVVDDAWYADVDPAGARRESAYDVRASRFGDSLGLTWRDVTERSRVEAERAATAERLKHLNAALRLQSEIAAHLVEGVNVVRNEDLVVLYTNEAWNAMFGYPAGEIIGQGIDVVVSPQQDRTSREMSRHIADTARATGRWAGDLLQRRRDGRELWTQCFVSSYHDPEHGDVFISTVVDITEARESRQLIDRLFATSIDLMGIVDRQGYLRRVNPAWSRTLGWTDEELTSARYDAFLHPDDRERAAAARHELDETEPVVGIELRWRCRDGGYRWLQANAVPLEDPPVTVVSMRDVTDHRRLEEAVRRGARQAELLALVSSTLARAGTDIGAISRSLAETLYRELGDRGGVLLLAPDGDRLEPVYFSDPEAHRLARRAFAEHPMLASRPGLYGEAMATGKVIIGPPTDPDSVIDELPPSWAAYLRRFPDYSTMWIPLRTRERRIGLLTLARGKDRPPFDEDDRLLGEAIGERVSLALDNALLFAAKDRAEREAREREALFHSAFDGGPVGAAMVSVEPADRGRCLLVNGALSELTGYRADELLGRDLDELIIGDDERSLVDLDATPGSPSWHEGRLRRADGAVLDVRIGTSVPHAGAGYCLTHIEDVTERRQALTQLETQALHDALTGLANRHLFVDRLQAALSALEREPGSVALIYVDIDHFKDINDSLGHEAGDAVLRAVGLRLKDAVRTVDTVARLAGDELVVLCPRTDCDAALHIVTRILDSLAEPIDLATGPVAVTASVGLALATSADTSADRLMHHADTAMYHAKRGGRNGWRVYDDAMGRRALHRHQIEQDLRDGLVHGRFRVHYQPVVDLRDGRIVGAEALLRLDHPRRGLLAPGAFIDVAEDSEVIVELGAWVLATACRQAAEWNDRFEPFDIAVNVSGRHAGRPRLLDDVHTALGTSGLDPTRLCLEVTERVLMDVGATVSEWFQQIAATDVRVALDDFGTGYSSMTYLERLPIDVVKIDRSFVAHLGPLGDGGSAIVRAISSLARDLDLRTVAEGVESPQQRDALRALGCDHAQGYLFHRPGPGERITELLATQ